MSLSRFFAHNRFIWHSKSGQLKNHFQCSHVLDICLKIQCSHVLDICLTIVCTLSRNMTKPTKLVYAQQRLRSAWASAQSDQSLHCPNEESWVPSYLLSDSEDWSDWADAQADLSLCWAHSHFVGFVMSRLICLNYRMAHSHKGRKRATSKAALQISTLTLRTWSSTGKTSMTVHSSEHPLVLEEYTAWLFSVHNLSYHSSHLRQLMR